MYVDKKSIAEALRMLRGTADAALKTWLTLKALGLTEDNPVEVQTTKASSGAQLEELFGYPGAVKEKYFFVPFGATTRWRSVSEEASRSIIQTEVKEWSEGNRQVDPREYLKIEKLPSGAWRVSTQPGYPKGLGFGQNGFARSEGQGVAIPIKAWAVWYGRQTAVPDEESDPAEYLVRQMLKSLNISSEEKAVLFAQDKEFIPIFSPTKVSDQDLNALVLDAMASTNESEAKVIELDEHAYARKLAAKRTQINGPRWLSASPEDTLKSLFNDGQGEKAILLYGPPRTGKTRAIDALVPRNSAERETIQIHDGWGYDHLMLGLKSTGNGAIGWCAGPLLTAIRSNKRYIVLEEVNRTQLAQSLGETFSLIESGYRGVEKAVKLRDGSDFYIPSETVFFFTMNTLDKSTEEIDDALLGRMAAVEFPPRVEDLHSILEGNGVAELHRDIIAEFFAGVREKYALGHAFFKDVVPGTSMQTYYLTRIRPVIQKHFSYRQSELQDIDLLADKLFRGLSV